MPWLNPRMAPAAAATLPLAPTHRGLAVARAAGKVFVLVLVLAALWGLWEAYRATWLHFGFTRPFVVDQTTMPHIHDMVGALFEPSRANGPLLIDLLLHSALFTAKEAAVGFALGTSIGFALGIVLAHSRLLSRGLMPYVVASQTIPILAIAPMVVIGLGYVDIFGWTPSDWQRVSVIAAYLSFFPVTINTVRGLHSADPRAIELMRSYAAGDWRILWKLRVPASLPYVFTALKIAATACVVGAIVGELPSSIQSGLGGAILNFNQYYTLDPENLWATNIIAALLGISFFLVIVIAEKLVVRRAPEHVG
jgi:NitT/TauT family transport system permease protein